MSTELIYIISIKMCPKEIIIDLTIVKFLGTNLQIWGQITVTCQICLKMRL